MALLDRPTAQPQAQELSLRVPFLWLLAVLAVGLAAFLAAAQSSRITQAGYGLRQSELERDNLLVETHRLEAEVAQLASLQRIALEAKGRLGMGPPERYQYLYVDVPAPGQERVPVAWQPAPPTPAPERSWWARLLSLLPLP